MYEVKSIHDLSSIIRSRPKANKHTWIGYLSVILCLGIVAFGGYVEFFPANNSRALANNQFSTLSLLISSPHPGQDIPASRVTIVGKASTEVCQLQATSPQPADSPEHSGHTGQAVAQPPHEPLYNLRGVIQKDRTFYIPNVGLHLGANSLEITGYDCSGQVQTTERLVVNSTSTQDPLLTQISPTTVKVGESTKVLVSTPLVAKELRVDFDGDKLFDAISHGLEVSHPFTNAGLYPIWAVLQTTDGLYFSSNLPSLTYGKPIVRVVNDYDAKERKLKVAVSLPDIVDLEISQQNEIWALSKFLKRLVQFDDKLFPQGSISLRDRGEIEEFSLFTNGDLIFVDHTRAEVVRIDKTGKVIKDFGQDGVIRQAENLKLQTPRDVFVDQDDFIFVTDTGNKRLLKFTARGKFVASLAFAVAPRLVAGEGTQIHVVDINGKVHLLADSLDEPGQVLAGDLRLRQLDKQRNNPYWTAITEEDKICLYLSSGTCLTEPFEVDQAQALRDAVLLPSLSQQRLIVGTAARLMMISLSTENLNLPEARWEEFLDALQHGNNDQLHDLLTEDAQVKLKDTMSLEDNQIRQYDEMLIPRERANDRAVFETRTKGSEVQDEVQVIFTRHDSSKPWKLDRFW